MIWQS